MVVLFLYLLNRINMIELLEKLINIPSCTREEGHIGQFLAHSLAEKGYIISKQYLDDHRFNLIATTARPPKIFFSTHMDTVTPFIPFQRDGKVIYGRGACDAKGAMACMIFAAEQLRKENVHDIGLLFVVGEELDSDGAKKAATLSLDSEYVIIGEPSDNTLVTAQKGTLVFKIKVSGKSAHSAYPEKGDSAIQRLLDILHKWQNFDWGRDDMLGSTTLNIGKVSGGEAVNIIADYAEAEGIFRIATSLVHVRERLLSYANDKVTIEILSGSQPQKMIALEGFKTTSVSWGSDAAYLNPLGKVLLLGPGSIDYAHSMNEQITIAELQEGINLYIKMVKKLLN